MFTFQSICISIFYNDIYNYNYILINNVTSIICNHLLPSFRQFVDPPSIENLYFIRFSSKPFEGISVKIYKNFFGVKQYIFVGVKIRQNFPANPIDGSFGFIPTFFFLSKSLFKCLLAK